MLIALQTAFANLVLTCTSAAIFMALERDPEIERRTAELELLVRLNASLPAADYEAVLGLLDQSAASVERGVEARPPSGPAALLSHFLIT